MFYNCSSLTSVTIGNGVTSIGDGAFSGCPIEAASIPALAIGYIPKSELETVTIASGTSIGGSAFYNCSSLTSVTIGNGVTSIGDKAFSYCSSLTSVTIGNSVTSIGGSAFWGCNALKGVHITDIAAWCNIEFGNYSNPLYYAHNLYLNNELVTDLVIPDSVTSIGDYAFYNCNSLTSVTIPDSVTRIGYGVFEYCYSLTSITIGDSVTSIGGYAFEYCRSLTSITIGNSVKSIGICAFYNCSSLTSVTIPDSVTSIDNSAINSERDFRKTQQKISNNIENSLQMMA